MKNFFKVFPLLSFLWVSLHSVEFNVGSDIISEVWFKFEPGEDFNLGGSDFLLKDDLTSKYYPNVSAFLAREKKSENSFGVRASWDRLSSNYLDIIPVNAPELRGVPISLSVWLWGNDSNIEVVALFTRGDGLTYAASFGTLNFKGWRKKSLELPNYVFRDNVSNREPLKKYKFDRFRIFVSPSQAVNDLFFFFDEFTVNQTVAHGSYDGFELEKVISDEIEGTSSGSNGSGGEQNAGGGDGSDGGEQGGGDAGNSGDGAGDGANGNAGGGAGGAGGGN